MVNGQHVSDAEPRPAPRLRQLLIQQGKYSVSVGGARAPVSPWGLIGILNPRSGGT